jgi:hypothetical protein
MIPEEIDELMNRELDGENSPDESAKLREILSSDPDARHAFNQLRGFYGKLSRIPPVDPPPALFSSVMKALPQAAVRASGRGSIIRSFFAALKPQGALRFGYAFAGGLALGLFLLMVFTQIRTDVTMKPSDVTGALFVDQSALSAGSTVRFEDEAVSGEFSVRYSPALAGLDVHIAAPGDVEIRCAYDPGKLTLQSIIPLDSPSSRIAVRSGELLLNASGDVTSSFFFYSPDGFTSPVHVVVLRSGTVIFQRSIPLNPGAG